jgi:type IV secretion system protein VirD4
MIKNTKEIPGVTNRDIASLKKKWFGRKTKVFFWLLFSFSGVMAYLFHPHIQTIESLYLKAGLSVLSLFIWPLWWMSASFWEQIQIGSTSVSEERFFYLFYGTAALTPVFIYLIRRYWGARVVSTQRADEYRIESHRRGMGRLNEKEALADFEMKNGVGLPLISLSPEPEKRNKKVIGLEVPNSHTVIISPTGGGKGMHLTELILATPGGMVVIDPKGEQFARTGGYRSQIGPVYTLPGNGIDLSKYFDFGSRDDIAELHFHMMKPWKDNQPIFADKTKSLFSAVGVFAKKHNLNPLFVLLSLAESDPSVSLKALAEAAPDLIAAFTNGREPGEMDRMAASSWGTFSTRLYSYWEHAHTITESGPFSIPEDWVEQKATIYVTYSFDQLKGSGGVISAVLAGLMRKRISMDARIPMVLAIDELIAVGVGNIDTYLATVRSYGISLVLYVQDYAQLVENYGDRAASILANCANKVWYPPNEMATAEMIEKLFGTELRPSYTHSRSLEKERMEVDMGKKQRSLSQRLETFPALAANEIQTLPDDEVICQVGSKVLKGYRMWPVPRLGEIGRLQQPAKITSSKKQGSINWDLYVPEAAPVEAARTPRKRSGI